MPSTSEQDKIKALKKEIDFLKEEALKAKELTDSVARANANAAEMYLELEEKSSQVAKLKEQMEEELYRARDVQIALMNRPLGKFPSLDITVRTKAASLINGDFYIIHPFDNNIIAFLVADGVGHGVPAALMTIMAKTFFTSISLSNYSASGIFTDLNQQLKDNLFEGGYITAFLVVYNFQTNEIKFSGAGHPDILFREKKTGLKYFLKAQNPPLGIIDDHEYIEDNVKVHKGDRFFLFTDGIEEARSPDGSFLGHDRMIDLIISGCPDKSVKEIRDHLFGVVGKFSQGTEQSDDQTFIGIEILNENVEFSLVDLINEFGIGSSPENYKRLFKIGADYLRKKEYGKSVFIYEKICSVDSTNIKALFNLGSAYARMNKISETREYWQKILDLFESNNTNKISEYERNKIKNKIGKYFKMLEESNKIEFKQFDHAELGELDISVDKNKLVEFFEKVVKIDTFKNLLVEKNSTAFTISEKGNSKSLSFAIDKEILEIDSSLFQNDLPELLYIALEGLAITFSGMYVVTYIDTENNVCKVNVVDGIYTHCGERCLVRNVEFPELGS